VSCISLIESAVTPGPVFTSAEPEPELPPEALSSSAFPQAPTVTAIASVAVTASRRDSRAFMGFSPWEWMLRLR
jgi:hypothetical protein